MGWDPRFADATVNARTNGDTRTWGKPRTKRGGQAARKRLREELTAKAQEANPLEPLKKRQRDEISREARGRIDERTALQHVWNADAQWRNSPFATQEELHCARADFPTVVSQEFCEDRLKQLQTVDIIGADHALLVERTRSRRTLLLDQIVAFHPKYQCCRASD